MKSFILFFLFIFLGLSVFSQECGTFHLFNFQDTVVDDWIWDEPKAGFSFDMSYDDLTATNTGYISFVMVDINGDTLTNPEYYRWSYFFPLKVGDTTRYKMVFRDNISTLPPNFQGYLHTTNPECSIPVSFVITDVDEIDIETDLEVFPNPTDDYIELKSSKQIVRVNVIDVNGIELQSIIYKENLDVRNLSSGVYLLSVYYSDGTKSVKSFIKR